MVRRGPTGSRSLSRYAKKESTFMPFFLPDTLIEQAIEDFSDEASRSLALYLAIPVRQRTPEERETITALRREIAAYARVADYWAAGLYPRAIDGLWEVASLSERGTQHHIWRENNRWVCDCKAAGRGYFHVHQAMMCVIERAQELAEQHGLEAEPAADAYECYEPLPQVDEEPWLCSGPLPALAGGDCPEHGPHEGDRCPRCEEEAARAWPADADVRRLAARLTRARAVAWQVAA